jgi:type IV pilus assembly protein PilY1
MPIRNPSLRFRLGATAFLLTMAGGYVAPFTPVVLAAPVPSPYPAPAPDSSTPAPASSALGVVDLSPAPPNDTQAAAPNIVVTFDDSGSMASDYMGDNRPFDNQSWSSRRSSSPWRCAGVIDPSASSGLGALAMNGVYYNPNVDYKPPTKADGYSFPQADASLTAVDNDGVAANRPLSPSNSGTTNFVGADKGWYWSSSYYGGGSWKWGGYPSGQGYYSNNDQSNKPSGTPRWPIPSGSDYTYGSYPELWTCPNDSQNPVGSGPYYYKYTGPALVDNGYGAPKNLGDLYDSDNWTAVAVPASEYQNWANWWAYYHTRMLMARTSLSRAFGALGATGSDGMSYGSSIRVAWQNLYTDDDFHLQDNTIISALMDANSPKCDPSSNSAKPSEGQQSGTPTTPPNCYRSAFFNWIFSVEPSGTTPTRAATIRAGQFFTRKNGNAGGTGDLHDPYWEPPPPKSDADGQELVCRQNFHMLVTDGYSNENDPSLPRSMPDGTGFKDSETSYTLPDGTIYSPTASESRIYWDNRGTGYSSSMANIAFNYWATNLRPDLYNAAKAKGITNPVTPYMPDTSVGKVPGASSGDLEKYFNPNNDPANWPHLVQYMVSLGVSGRLVHSDDYDCKASDDACSLRTGAATSYTSNNTNKGWPRLDNNAPEGIDDLWHAAVNSRGSYFNASNPSDLTDQLSRILTNISARSAKPSVSAVNASVLTLGALSFNTGYSSADWSGVLQAVTLKEDGTTSAVKWDAQVKLADVDYTKRKVFTLNKDSTGKMTGMDFTSGATFDDFEKAGLMVPASSGDEDTLANRVDYLRGDQDLESGGTMRPRNKQLLGAIINSQAVYVSYPSGGYSDNYPTGSPEAADGAQTYDDFITIHADRPGTLYVGANDGMLHAFDASLECNSTDKDGNCTSYGPDQAATAGEERWAFVPRAVYPNLGTLTSGSNFKFAPTVDGSPVIRDVFFNKGWHTLLVGGLRLGGRGVYALDVTDPTTMTKDNVLWEFDADSAVSSGCVVIEGGAKSGDKCNPDDLGYTYGQPNIGRLANGKWVVIVPTGYYPDCSKGDAPANCETLAAASNKYSALFVLDAQTGAQIAEIRTPEPTSSDDVVSYGLSSPVLGDYENDHIDDVAYAGDLNGNLWRFDLSDVSPSNWKVTLAYKPASQGVQPITVMPRLFPDPTTNRFMVVFGTGKYLGADDNTSASAPTQSVYGIRDKLDDDGPVTITHDELQAQVLTEQQGSGDLEGVTLRKLSSNDVDASEGGWYIDLDTKGSDGSASGERVVVTPAALFDTNTAIVQTLIPGGNDPCNPTVLGAVMFIDANSGGPGGGVSSVGGAPYVGARVNNVRTSGSIPVATTVGGGKALLPGLTLTGSKKNPDTPFAGDAPVWRRRSWSVINNVH